MRQTVVPGVWSWSRWQPDRGMDFNGFLIETPEGNLVVDPVDPGPDVLDALRRRGVTAVVVTNRDHERASALVIEATGAPLIAAETEAPLLTLSVDRTVRNGESVLGWIVTALHGAKTPGEIALVQPVLRTALVGDLLWGAPAGALTLMPDDKLADARRAVLSLRALRARSLDHLLVGDGACIFGGASAAIGAVIDARDGVPVNVVNLFDEMPYAANRYEGASFDPPPYTGLWAEVGLLLGARRLGYAATVLRRGEAFSPYHWHTREEELFVVMRGAPSVRSARGTFRLRSGDCIAFSTDPRGAHQLFNEGEEDAVVLLVANIDDGDVCSYPDSRKVLVEQTGTLVRDHPQLAYFDGEV